MKSAKWLALTLALPFGALMACSTLDIGQLSELSANPAIASIQQFFIALIMPGMLGSAAFSGNVHAWHLWMAAVINGLVYACLLMVAIRLLLLAFTKR